MQDAPKESLNLYLLSLKIDRVAYSFDCYMKIFKTKWWDYSERKFNLNGRICLKNSLLFGILTLILYYLYIYYQKLSTRLLKNKIYIAIILIIIILIIIDGIITIVEALELKRRLEIIDNKSDNKNTLKEQHKDLLSVGCFPYDLFTRIVIQ